MSRVLKIRDIERMENTSVAYLVEPGTGGSTTSLTCWGAKKIEDVVYDATDLCTRIVC